MLPLPSQVNLQRYPKTSDRSLRAWSAADELLLEHLLSEKQQWLKELSAGKTLLINDQFGALSVCFNSLAPYYWTDSHLSSLAIQSNLRNNLGDESKAVPISCQFKVGSDANCKLTSFSNLPNDTQFELVIIRVPKHHSLLSLQLEAIKPYLSPDALIIAAGMTKDIHNATLNIFQQSMGPTTTSLAKKKARLIFSQWINSPAAPIELSEYRLEKEGITMVGLPGVFSRDKLDIGTRVLLNYLPDLHAQQNVIDLGCGNGVIGAILAKRQPEANFLLSDESALAVASAQLTFARNHLSNGQFIQTDVLQNVKEGQYHHVLCNPPFHQQNVQTLSIAHNMFRQAAQKLVAQGELRVVANRHLAYAPVLKKYFRQVNPISADSKFTVWLASSPIK